MTEPTPQTTDFRNEQEVPLSREEVSAIELLFLEQEVSDLKNQASVEISQLDGITERLRVMLTNTNLDNVYISKIEGLLGDIENLKLLQGDSSVREKQQSIDQIKDLIKTDNRLFIFGLPNEFSADKLAEIESRIPTLLQVLDSYGFTEKIGLVGGNFPTKITAGGLRQLNIEADNWGVRLQELLEPQEAPVIAVVDELLAEEDAQNRENWLKRWWKKLGDINIYNLIKKSAEDKPDGFWAKGQQELDGSPDWIKKAGTVTLKGANVRTGIGALLLGAGVAVMMNIGGYEQADDSDKTQIKTEAKTGGDTSSSKQDDELTVSSTKTTGDVELAKDFKLPKGQIDLNDLDHTTNPDLFKFSQETNLSEPELVYLQKLCNQYNLTPDKENLKAILTAGEYFSGKKTEVFDHLSKSNVNSQIKGLSEARGLVLKLLVSENKIDKAVEFFQNECDNALPRGFKKLGLEDLDNSVEVGKLLADFYSNDSSNHEEVSSNIYDFLKHTAYRDINQAEKSKEITKIDGELEGRPRLLDVEDKDSVEGQIRNLGLGMDLEAISADQFDQIVVDSESDDVEVASSSKSSSSKDKKVEKSVSESVKKFNLIMKILGKNHKPDASKLIENGILDKEWRKLAITAKGNTPSLDINIVLFRARYIDGLNKLLNNKDLNNEVKDLMRAKIAKLISSTEKSYGNVYALEMGGGDKEGAGAVDDKETSDKEKINKLLEENKDLVIWLAQTDSDPDTTKEYKQKTSSLLNRLQKAEKNNTVGLVRGLLELTQRLKTEIETASDLSSTNDVVEEQVDSKKQVEKKEEKKVEKAESQTTAPVEVEQTITPRDILKKNTKLIVWLGQVEDNYELSPDYFNKVKKLTEDFEKACDSGDINKIKEILEQIKQFKQEIEGETSENTNDTAEAVDYKLTQQDKELLNWLGKEGVVKELKTAKVGSTLKSHQLQDQFLVAENHRDPKEIKDVLKEIRAFKKRLELS